MAKIAIICHIERLWPEYETGQAYFGLNLSASFDGEQGTKEEALSLLMPWLWGGVEKIHVKRQSAATAEAIDDIEYVIGAGDLFDPEPIKNAVMDEANDMLASRNEGVESFVWRPAIGTEEEQETRRYFRNLLGYVSTLPAPAPQKLNLSLCFKLPVGSLTVGDLIYAVPEFKGGALGDIKPLASGPDVSFSRSGIQVFPWSYSGGTHTVKAYTVPWTVVASETTPATSFIDFSSYWIKRELKPGDQTWYGSDWTVRLESKVAGAFDMAQRVIDAFRTNLGEFKKPAKFNDKDYAENVLKFFRQSVVAATRDLAGTGVQSGADGADVAEYLLSRCRDSVLEKSGLLESLKLSMRGALEGYNRTQNLAEWRKLLRAIPAIANTAAVNAPDGFRRRDQLDDELNELEAIQSALADENNLRGLLLTQWEAAVNGVASSSVSQPQADYFQSIRPGKGDTGLLNLSNDQTWVLTLANVNLGKWLAGSSVTFRVTDPKQPSPNQMTLDVTLNANKLNINLHDAKGALKAQGQFQFSPGYHLRLQITRKGEKEWRVTPQFFGANSPSWLTIGTGEVLVTTDSTLNAASISVGVTAGEEINATFAPPSALAAQPDKVAEAIAAWDSLQINKARHFFDRFSTQLRNTILPPIQLRQRLAAGNIGRIWGEVVGTSDVIVIENVESKDGELGRLVANLKQKLMDYFDGRIVGVAPGYADYLKLPGGGQTTDEIKNLIRENLKTFIEGFKPLLLPNSGDSVDEGDSSPTEISQGVTIQVDRLDKFVEGDASDAQDFLRRIAGVGLLMRQAANGVPPSPWRCLNLAELRAEKPAALNDEKLKLVYAKSLAPYRLTYQNDLRQALVTYNDSPLIAKSPAAKLSGDVSLEEELERDGIARIEYTPAHKNSDWAKLPPLKFGQNYDVAAFVIGNSGALPKELANGHPAKLLDSTVGFQPNLDQYSRRLKYLRRVRVARPRFAQFDRIGKVGKFEIQLPRIPDQVLPLAGELKLKRDSISGIPLPDPSEDMTFDNNDPTKPVINASIQHLPLLLLPYRKGNKLQEEFSFGLRKPATDLTTWSRWLAKDQESDASIAQKREQVWADYHRKAPKEDDRATEDNREDISLDDPAAANFFVAELVPMRARAMAAAKVATVLIKTPSSVGGVDLAQSPPVTVRCKRGELSNIIEENGELKVTVGYGEVVELRIYVPVMAKWFDDDDLRRFHKLPPPKEGAWKKFQSDFYLFSPLRMVLEGASNELPSADQLWNAIRPVTIGSRLAVHFDRGATNPNNKFDYVAKVDLRRQLWRWQGRPLTEFPALTTAGQGQINDLPGDGDSPANNAFLWDAEGFGDRGDDDYMLTSTTINLPVNSQILFEDDRNQDRRALYYRFAVRAHSRYRGLLTNNSPEFMDSSRDALPTIPRLNPRDRWKRHLMNCRWQDEVPKPQVKFIVPLTESASATGSSKAQLPGLLVVLNETWYEVGGLAETLVAEMQRVANPEAGKPGEPLSYPEFGPDPILTGDAWSGGNMTMNVSQPLGHTFDTDSDAPLFVASSCVLSLPDLPKSVEDKWCFAKINFKRRLTVNGANQVDSKPTDPYWVQLLPDFSEFSDNFDYENLRLRRESAVSNSVVIVSGKDPAVLPTNPALAGVNQFTRWLLLTQVIRDMRGRRDQERYVGLYRMQASGVCHPLDEQTQIGSDWKLRARIVEVQYRVETLGSLRGSEVYYDGVNLDAGKQWAVTLSGVTGSFADQKGYSFSINKPSDTSVETRLLGITVTYGADGSAILQLQKDGNPVGQATISNAKTKSPYALRLVLTKAEIGWKASAQCQTGANWQEFGTTMLDTLSGISVKVALNSDSQQSQLNYIAPSLTAEPWDHLFPLELSAATPEDAKARIVRVSRPIEMESV